MDCKKAQRLMQDCGDGRLGDVVAREVQRHFGECSDCRVAQQRALHLQQLLAVKRHETPGQHYFDNFLGNFQRRLAREIAPTPTLWQRVCLRLHIEPVLHLRYGFAHALGVVFAVALVWRGIVASDLPGSIDRLADNDSLTPALTASTLPVPHSTPQAIASALPAPAAVPASTFTMPVATLHDLSVPRYILDRISLSPASYEVASIHF